MVCCKYVKSKYGSKAVQNTFSCVFCTALVVDLETILRNKLKMQHDESSQNIKEDMLTEFHVNNTSG